MRYFTVYDCTQCPDADNEAGVCYRHVNDQFGITGHTTVEDYAQAMQLYRDNCMGLAPTCPRLL
jgi:hypothetical protein